MRSSTLPLVFAALAAGVALAADPPKLAPPPAGVKAPSGFDVTLYAAPPDVSYPTCLAAAPDGSFVFVGVDQNSSLDAKSDRGKVVRCRDTDGDGKADQFVTFCTLDSPRGLWWDNKKTLIVLHPPFVSAYHDDDGDGKADRNDTLVSGLGFDLKFRGADHTTNQFRVGIDGWLYIAVGDYGAIKAVGKDGRTLQVRGGGVVRVRTDGTGLEAVSQGQRNIYDVAVSPTLDLFTRDNTNDGGGWDVRLSHVVPTGNYGYPRLFKNFADDIVQPLADYGGGSPTGALFLDEPNLPTPNGLYSVEWGKNGIFRHPLTAAGASWKAGQEMFLPIPRPTDMDVDGLGHLYVSSWKGGEYKFAGPNVGFVARLTATGAKSAAFPDLAKATDADLLKYLSSPSAVLRLYASREIVGRGAKPGTDAALEKLAAGDGPAGVRVAVIFTLKQLLGANATPALERLTKVEAVREYALKALTDDPATAVAAPVRSLIDGTRDASARVRAQAAIGLGRVGNADAAAAVLPLVADQDPVVAHVAVNALVALKASDVCLKALDGAAPSGIVPGALRVLRQLHTPAVVDGLTARLATAKEETLRHGILVALARLYQQEAPWDGKWWTTRPDTTGPYYTPAKWAGSDKIGAALKKTLADADPAETKWLVTELNRHKVDLPEVMTAMVKLSGTDPEFRRKVAGMLSARGTPPAAAVPLFAAVAADPAADAATRATAVRGLIKLPGNEAARTAVLTALASEDKLPAALEPLWAEFVREGKHTEAVPEFVKLTKQGTPAQRELVYGVLASISDRPLGTKEARAAATDAVKTGLADPAAAPVVLKAIARLTLTSFAPQVRPLLASADQAVAAAARDALKAMKLDPTSAASNVPTIGKMKYEDVAAAAVKEKGVADLGGKLFERVGCVNCHTTSASEPLKGPMLAGIATRYSRAELVESIVKPSAKLAQGFETFTFNMADGKTVTGFIIREAGTEVEVRDAAGATTVLKKEDIEDRKHGKLSVMPEQLVDHLTPVELASVLAYLESLKTQ